MNMLIIYGTKYGCTEKCAKTLSTKLTGKVDLCNIKKDAPPDLSKYDKVIIGGSIYIGKIHKEVTEFCAKNLGILMSKKIGLFMCGMRDGDEANTELNASFPKELLEVAIVRENLGGEFVFSKMSFFDKLIVKKVAKIDKDTSNISEEAINKFANLMNLA